MFNKLDASKYDYSALFYEKNFELILSKITLCYLLMKSHNPTLENNENKIRDALLINYLRKNEVKEKLKLTDWIFDREVPEDTTVGRVDIRVISFDTFKIQEAYYIIECKRLDNVNTTGKTGLNAEYIKNGISRFTEFTENYYTSYYRVNGMIGFIVEKMDIHSNTKKINKLLKDFGIPITTKYLTKDSFIPGFEYHYHSTHLDNNNDELKIYHLMFEFHENIVISTIK
jgi:hypothetical protein